MGLHRQAEEAELPVMQEPDMGGWWKEMRHQDDHFVVFVIIFFVMCGLVIGLLMFNPIVVIGPGERGVMFDSFTGVQPGVLGEGLYWTIPIIQHIQPFNVKILREDAQAEAASKDLQVVSAAVAINYHINPNKVDKLYQEIGIEVSQTIIDPAIQESIKATTALFTAEELITQREVVKMKIQEELESRLNHRYLIIDSLQITDLDFSEQFNKAVEGKVTAQQDAFKAQRDLERITIEAKQRIVQAEAEASATLLAAKANAEALEIQKKALEDAPGLVQYKAIEKWDGVLPKITSGAIPFINVDEALR